MKEVFVDLDKLKEISKEMGNNVLYRGHSSADYKLLPTIGRRDFGTANPDEVEKVIFERFKLQSQKYFRNHVGNDLDWLIMARHYGLHTRLLDWTRNIYVALYFSLQGRSKHKHEPFSIIVYRDPNIKSYFQIKEQDPFTILEDTFFEPPSIDDRIPNQQSILCIHQKPTMEIEGDQLLQLNVYPNDESLREIEAELITVGIRHSMIYPGPDGIAKHINENPNEMGMVFNFKVEKEEWRPVAKWMIGKTQLEIEKILLKEKSFISLLEMNLDNPSNLIGMPVHFGDQLLYFRTFIPGEKSLVFLSQNGMKKKAIDLDSSIAKDLKTPSTVLKAMFGKGMTFIRKVEEKAKEDDLIKTRSPRVKKSKASK
jgi:hypothetical protein